MELLLRRWVGAVLLMMLVGLVGCNGSNAQGDVNWIQPYNDTPRAGTVVLIRGWSGVFSAGIDAMGRQLKEQGLAAHVYMPEQHPEIAKAMLEKYRGVTNPEPLVFVGHSRGVDASIIIARELAKEGIPVDLMVLLDSVDEKVVTKNVKVTYNYWMPGIFFGTNLFRGIPLVLEEGSTGTIYNYNLNKEGREFREPYTEHIYADDDPKLQKRIMGHVLEVCPERSVWEAKHGKAPRPAAAPLKP
jgi:hypothetical protein